MTRKNKKIQKAEPMDVDRGYNGWKNYETWAIVLWIDNEEGSYRRARRLALSAKNEAEESAAEVEGTGRGIAREARGILADTLKEWMAEEMPDLGASVWSDLLNAAFGEIDWYEAADQFLAE